MEENALPDYFYRLSPGVFEYTEINPLGEGLVLTEKHAVCSGRELSLLVKRYTIP